MFTRAPAAVEVAQQHTERPGDIELRPQDDSLENRTPASDVTDDSDRLTKQNIIKIVVAGFSFFFAGTNDGSLGALTPYILRSYHVGTQYVALMYVLHKSFHSLSN